MGSDGVKCRCYIWIREPYIDYRFGHALAIWAADSGGQEGQPSLLAKSRRGKTTSLPLHLADSSGWRSYIWVFVTSEAEGRASSTENKGNPEYERPAGRTWSRF